MTDAFAVSFAIDEAHRIIRIKAVGPVDSSRVVDECLAFFGKIEEPWRYDRLNDQTWCTGYVNYGDLERLAALWAPIMRHAQRRPKVAVVSMSGLVAARMPTVHQLLTGHDHQALVSLDEAEAWLPGPD